jgi:hypothetical protein
MEHRDRGLVFVPTLRLGQTMANELGIPFYNGAKELTKEQRHNMFKDFVRGHSQFMICTSAFGVGFDYPHVRLTIHAGTPMDYLSTIQEIGRNGRDGAPSCAHLLPTASFKLRACPVGLTDHKGSQEVYALFHGSVGCVRNHVTLFSDGKGRLCDPESGDLLCSDCEYERDDLGPLTTPPRRSPARPARSGSPLRSSAQRDLSRRCALPQSSLPGDSSQPGEGSLPSNGPLSRSSLPRRDESRPLAAKLLNGNSRLFSQASSQAPRDSGSDRRSLSGPAGSSGSCPPPPPYPSKRRRAEENAAGDSDYPQKRVCGSPRSSFKASNQRAQQRTQELEAEKAHLLQQIAEALEWARCECVPCHVTGVADMPRHTLQECPAIQRLGGFGKLFDDRKEAVEYKWHKHICFKCHVPMMGQLHSEGFTTRFADNCGDNGDIIWPVVWAILSVGEMRADAERHFRCWWSNLFAFNLWNNDQKSVKDYGTGLLALFLWYHKVYRW